MLAFEILIISLLNQTLCFITKISFRFALYLSISILWWRHKGVDAHNAQRYVELNFFEPGKYMR